MTDIRKLKALAEAANAEFPLAPWAYEPHGDTGTYGVGVLQNQTDLCVLGRQEPGEMLVVEPVAADVAKEKYAAFIAACSPGVVLGLISALESKSGFLDEFIHAHKSLVSQRDQLKAENEELRASKNTVECRFEVSEDTLETIRGCLKAAESDIDQLKTENEALRKDAGRYQWLMKRGLHTVIYADSAAVAPGRGPYVCIDLPSTGAPNRVALGSGADAYIDAAMSKEQGAQAMTWTQLKHLLNTARVMHDGRGGYFFAGVQA